MATAPDQLLVRVRDGDRDAYAQLYAQLAPAVLGILRRQLAGRDDMVDEAMQETWIRVWRHARRYDPALGPALGWIASIARNEARRQGGRSRDEATALPELADMAREMDELPAILQGAGLDQLDRQLCYLAFYLDCTHAEMAAQLGLPLGTVKGRMRRILRIMRSKYDA
jgi:RNA polymerase sigma-70 factor (ECF subfamily)